MATGYKTGGRQAGTPNVLTKQLRGVLKKVLAKEYENLPTLLDKLEPKYRFDAIVKLSHFILPKVQDVSMTAYEPYDLSLE